ncbi:hypothetical protein Nepgr_025801 [Nepenthes gracilis]|uniref:Glycosyltransferase n=1 Tax=Nepenthes gracilis TaxID=150966 RepID=A0AAD3T5P4_NEPGR|nr:hypothetical protein Nepgr_025801 [Nepenthes gracilis]
MKAAELIFIPLAAMGHLVPAVELAKRLVARDERISITVLVLKLPFDEIESYIQSLKTNAAIDRGIKFLVLPEPENPIVMSSKRSVKKTVEAYKPLVKQIVRELIVNRPDSESQLVRGFVIDMSCVQMMDVATEHNLPCYVFFASGAGFLNFMLHLQSLSDDHGVDVTELKDPNNELDIPGFRNRVPFKVLPTLVWDKEFGCSYLLELARGYRKAKGIIINTFMELESDTLHAVSKGADFPPIYPAGLIINVNPQSDGRADGTDGTRDSIVRWLDDQPPASVVFLCFGSMGSMGVDQMREVADGLEQSGHRFVWALRRPSSGGGKLGLRDYENFEDVLPAGFLDRTAGIGRVVGWAPQAAILSHRATGAFVSHCGWNSTLESLWCGVPIAAWPMYAEQQLNAFSLVRELGLAVEIRLDYVWDRWTQSSNVLVKADELEKGIRQVMDAESVVRKKAKTMREVSRMAMVEGGSSYTWLGHFVEDVLRT